MAHIHNDGPMAQDVGFEELVSRYYGPLYQFAFSLARTDADGGSRMTLRNRGEPSGFGKVAGPVMASAMRRANKNDLARLKEILEVA